MTEAQLRSQILRYLNSIPGAFFFPIPQGPFSRVGISDLIGLYHGQFFALEVKTGNNQLTKKQDIFLSKVRAAGGVGQVARSIEDVKMIMEMADELR